MLTTCTNNDDTNKQTLTAQPFPIAHPQPKPFHVTFFMSNAEPSCAVQTELVDSEPVFPSHSQTSSARLCWTPQQTSLSTSNLSLLARCSLSHVFEHPAPTLSSISQILSIGNSAPYNQCSAPPSSLVYL